MSETTDKLIAAINKACDKVAAVDKPVGKPAANQQRRGSYLTDEEYREQVRRWRYVQQYSMWF